MNILVIQYLPSGESSNTGKLLQYFLKKARYHNVQTLDLLETPPIFHNLQTMQAYKQRNFGGQALDEALSTAIAPMDKLTRQFKSADLIVLATPMHNFSLPGLVKTYFDAVMQSGEVFTTKDDRQVGLMSKSKFVTIYTSMGSYNGQYGFMDNLKTLMKIELDFMGFKDYDFIHAPTGNSLTLDLHFKDAETKIDELVIKWL